MKNPETPVKQQSNNEMTFENIKTGKTRHVYGYGLGVTFTGSAFAWNQDVTLTTARDLMFSSPTVVTH